MTAGVVQRLSLDKIRIDGGTQSRESLSDGTVQEYAAAMRDGTNFPPVTVFHDGSEYWLADGFHRVLAAKTAEKDSIAASVMIGTKRDALLFSVGSNTSHGLPRTNADKRRAVLMLLKDAEWVQWSDREIARRCCVSGSYVGQLRPLTVNVDSDNGSKTFTTKHGTTSTMRTENIGRNQPAEKRAIEIRQLAKEGHRATQIAERLNIGEQQVRKLANRHGIELPDKLIGNSRAIDARIVIETTVHGLEGYAQGLRIIEGNLGPIEKADAREWLESLTASLRPLHALQKSLREIVDV